MTTEKLNLERSEVKSLKSRIKQLNRDLQHEQKTSGKRLSEIQTTTQRYQIYQITDHDSGCIYIKQQKQIMTRF